MGARRQPVAVIAARAGLALGLASAVAWFGYGIAAGEVDDGARQEAAAAAHRAGEHADRSEFVAAAVQFATAFETLDAAGPTSESDRTLLGQYLFGWAKVEELGGNCGCAVTLYERFAAIFPASVAWQQKARTAGVACASAAPTPDLCHRPVRTETVATPDAGVAPDAAPVALPPPPPEVIPVSRAPWYRDPLGGGLTVAGVGLAATGGWYVRRSLADAREARAAGIAYVDYVERAGDARRHAKLGWGLAGGGAALLVGAAVRYWRVATDTHVEVAAPANGGGAVVGIRGRF